jgi:epoxyqueuosine reductase QueG
VKQVVTDADTVTRYRLPLVAFADADDPRFARIREVADPGHRMPHDLLPGARSVIAFFVPFHPDVVLPNAVHPEIVAGEWARAYVETNELIGEVTRRLRIFLEQQGERAAADPPTGNFDERSLTSRWSHKSAAVISGLGSFGLHQMVITDAGCAGRLGSLVTSARLLTSSPELRERCLYFHDGSCRQCMRLCPLDALSTEEPFNRRVCWGRCSEVALRFTHLGTAEICGKCVVGPCAFESPATAPGRRG